MGFPGRLEEKKHIAFGFWICAVAVFALIFWGIWSVTKALKGPVVVQPQEETHAVDTPGFIRNTAERFEDNTKQIIDGKPLEKPKARVHSQAVYSAPPKGEVTAKDGDSQENYYQDSQ